MNKVLANMQSSNQAFLYTGWKLELMKQIIVCPKERKKIMDLSFTPQEYGGTTAKTIQESSGMCIISQMWQIADFWNIESL